jgi:hypothetical protein
MAGLIGKRFAPQLATLARSSQGLRDGQGNGGKARDDGWKTCLRACIGDCLPCRHILIHLALRKPAPDTGDLALGECLSIGPAGTTMRCGLLDEASHSGDRESDSEEICATYPMPAP